MSEETKEFERKRIYYFSEFKKQHIDSFLPHYERGETAGEGPDIWQNVSQHCLAAGIFASILCDLLRISKVTKNKIVEAAILHDWYKKHESLALQAAMNEGTISLEVISEIKGKDAQLLREMGVNEEVISLTDANTPKTVDGPQTIPEKIIWYVDAMLSNTEAVPIRQRLDNLERGWDGRKQDPVRAQRNNVTSNLYREKFRGKSMYDVQRELGDKIGAEFTRIMRYDGEISLLPLFLGEKLKNLITLS